MTRALDQALALNGRNYFWDPGLTISQANAAGALISLSTSFALYFPCDIVRAQRGGSTGAATVQQLAVATPGSSSTRLRMTVTAVNASPASSDLLIFRCPLEGLDVSPLRFGTATAKQITLRFGVRSSMAGIFPVSVRNGAYGGTDRSWLGALTILPAEVGLDVVKTVTLIGDTTAGLWAVDTSMGLEVSVCLCAGSGWQGTAGIWQTGSKFGLSTGANLMSVNGATFDLFDIGLYEGPVAHRFVLPDATVTFQKAMRYFLSWTGAQFFYAIQGETANFRSFALSLPVPMRTSPTCSITSANPGAGSWVSGYPLVEASSPFSVHLRGDVPSSWATVNGVLADARM